MMAPMTKIKPTLPSNPKDFFRKIYGDLDKNRDTDIEKDNVTQPKEKLQADQSIKCNQLMYNVINNETDKLSCEIKDKNITHDERHCLNCKRDEAKSQEEETIRRIRADDIRRQYYEPIVPVPLLASALPIFIPAETQFAAAAAAGLSAFLARRRRKEGRPRRQRTTFSSDQTLRLELEYQGSEYISRSKRCALADELGLSETQIKIWFQNRRAKDKRIEKAHLDHHYRKLLGSFQSTTCSACPDNPCFHNMHPLLNLNQNYGNNVPVATSVDSNKN